MTENGEKVERRRRTDQLVTCCKSLAWAVLPFIAHALGRALEEWARHHQRTGG